MCIEIWLDLSPDCQSSMEGADLSALMCKKSNGNEDQLVHFMGSIQKHKYGTIKTHVDICTHLMKGVDFISISILWLQPLAG